MTPAFLQRQAALAAGALLATLGVLAASDRGADVPLPPVRAEITWESAVVGLLPPTAYARETACGIKLDSGTLGIAHPVLPCGVDLVVAYRGREARAEVVERGPIEDGRDFDLTQALADRLGLRGQQEVRWRFAD